MEQLRVGPGLDKQTSSWTILQKGLMSIRSEDSLMEMVQALITQIQTGRVNESFGPMLGASNPTLLLSAVLGAIEHRECVGPGAADGQGDRSSRKVFPLEGVFECFEEAKGLAKGLLCVSETRTLCCDCFLRVVVKRAGRIVWKRLSGTMSNSILHAQNVFSFLKGDKTLRRLDCFGLAITTAELANTWLLENGFPPQIRIQLSEDHCWLAWKSTFKRDPQQQGECSSCGQKAQKLVNTKWSTAEIARKPSPSESSQLAKKGQGCGDRLSDKAGSQWLYARGHPCCCGSDLETLGAVASNVCEDVGTSSKVKAKRTKAKRAGTDRLKSGKREWSTLVMTIKFRILFVLFRIGALDKLPFALAELANLFEEVASSDFNPYNATSFPKPAEQAIAGESQAPPKDPSAPLPTCLVDCFRCYDLAIASSLLHFDGAFCYPALCKATTAFMHCELRWALRTGAVATAMVGRYTYDPGDSQLVKAIDEIFEEAAIRFKSFLANFDKKAKVDCVEHIPNLVVSVFINLMQLFDGLFLWQEAAQKNAAFQPSWGKFLLRVILPLLRLCRVHSPTTDVSVLEFLSAEETGLPHLPGGSQANLGAASGPAIISNVPPSVWFLGRPFFSRKAQELLAYFTNASSSSQLSGQGPQESVWAQKIHKGTLELMLEPASFASWGSSQGQKHSLLSESTERTSSTNCSRSRRSKSKKRKF